MKIQRLYCNTCEKQTKAVSTGTSHGLHAFLSVITGGLWLIVWGLKTGSNNRRWQCDVCGSDVSRSHSRAKIKRQARSSGQSLAIILSLMAVLSLISFFEDSPDPKPVAPVFVTKLAP